jgi:hypothetical protein
MGMIATITGALCVWIVLWAIGAKSFDGFLLAIVIAIFAVGWRMISANLPGNREH